MQIVESRVRKCQSMVVLLDKKMRERKSIYDHYIVPLNDNHPFETDEFVKVVRKKDFEKIGDMMKSLKSEREEHQRQINELTLLVENQRNYIEMLESGKNKDKASFFKELLKI